MYFVSYLDGESSSDEEEMELDGYQEGATPVTHSSDNNDDEGFYGEDGKDENSVAIFGMERGSEDGDLGQECRVDSTLYDEDEVGLIDYGEGFKVEDDMDVYGNDDEEMTPLDDNKEVQESERLLSDKCND